MIEVKLWRFSLPETDEVLYLYSLRSDGIYLREQFVHQDGGDCPWQIYKKLQEEGKIERITSIEQVPSGEPGAAPCDKNGQRDWYPYHSLEIENNEFELTVQQFLSPPDRYK